MHQDEIQKLSDNAAKMKTMIDQLPADARQEIHRIAALNTLRAMKNRQPPYFELQRDEISLTGLIDTSDGSYRIVETAVLEEAFASEMARRQHATN